MSKKVSTESSNVFDLTALKLLISVVAISLASMMSRAATMPVNVFYPSMAVAAKAKADLLLCPVPYSADYCLKEKSNYSCEYQEVSFLKYLNLTSFSKLGINHRCTKDGSGFMQQDS